MAEEPSRCVWRSIDDLAALVGAYCWVDERVFALAGAWASRPAADEAEHEAELRVWCAATSRRHGARAARWAEHLPVRADVDPDALVTEPSRSLAACLDQLAAQPDLRRGVASLVDGLLPALAAIYDAHRRVASPVSEGPILEVLSEAHREVVAEIQGGGSLIGGVGPGRDAPGGLVHARETFERLLNESGVFPAVRPS